MLQLFWWNALTPRGLPRVSLIFFIIIIVIMATNYGNHDNISDVVRFLCLGRAWKMSGLGGLHSPEDERIKENNALKEWMGDNGVWVFDRSDWGVAPHALSVAVSERGFRRPVVCRLTLGKQQRSRPRIGAEEEVQGAMAGGQEHVFGRLLLGTGLWRMVFCKFSRGC